MDGMQDHMQFTTLMRELTRVANALEAIAKAQDPSFETREDTNKRVLQRAAVDRAGSEKGNG